MQLRKYILGELLHLANSRPPWWRSEFYLIKDRVLTLYGTWEGVHLQHIVKHCYDCEGTGKMITAEFVFGFPVSISGGRKCARCGGSGKFDEFWTVLPVYRLGDRRFHIPKEKYYTRSSVPDLQFDQEIEGYVRHDLPKYHLASEAGYWLALIFDQKLFWQRFGHTGYLGRKFTPMVILCTWIYNMRRLKEIPYYIDRRISLWKLRITNFKQDHCQHDFPWTEEPSVWDECRKCGLERLYAEQGRDAVPF